MTRIGSLCSGTGRFDDAVAYVLDSSPAWFAEKDPDAQRVLKASHSGVPIHEDITVIDWTTEVAPVSMLSMGIPCQPVSAAGLQLAENDPRWLWPAAHAALHALKPRGFAFENVRNLISIQNGDLWRMILADMRALGYMVRWLTVGACAVGGCHHRHRVFAIGILMGDRAPEATRVKIQECGAPRKGGRILLPTPLLRPSRDNGVGDADYWEGRIARKGSKNGIPLPDVIGMLSDSQLLPTPRATDGVNGGPGQRGSSGDLAMSSAVQPEHWGKYAEAVALWEAIAGPAPAPTEPNANGAPRLSSAFPEWMMDMPAGHLTAQVDRNPALRLAGNAVHFSQAVAALRILLDV